MISSSRSVSLLAVWFSLVIQSSLARAQSTSPSASTTTQSAAAPTFTGNGDGGGGGAPEPTGAAGANAAGAAGGGVGSLNLSEGATIAIAVVVSIVVVLGVASMVLWYLAKKRQWKVSESIRRSLRKAGDAIRSPLSPLTPRRMTFSTRDTAKIHGGARPRDSPPLAQREKQPPRVSTRERDQDVEKGEPATGKPKVSPLTIPGKRPPRNHFDVDTPGSVKVSFWSKVFGRK